MAQMLQEKGISLYKSSELEIVVCDLKEKLSYVASDFDEEIKKDEKIQNYQLPDGKVCEIMFLIKFQIHFLSFR